LFALERYQQDNLKLLFYFLFKRIAQESKQSPKEKIAALTSLSDEKKREMFEAYYDPLASDYIDIPICIKGKYYDLLTWVSRLVQDSGIEVNLSGTPESAIRLNQEIHSRHMQNIGGSYAVYLATEEKNRASELLELVFSNIQRRTHSSEAWQQFIDEVADQKVYVTAINQTGHILLSGDVETVKGLLADHSRILQPKILQDLKYVGCTLSDPYSREPIAISDVKAGSDDYWTDLDQRIAEGEFANIIANKYKAMLSSGLLSSGLLRKVLDYSDVKILKAFYIGLVKMTQEMICVCSGKEQFDLFQAGITARYEALSAQVKDKKEHSDQGQYLVDVLQSDLLLLQQTAPRVLSYANSGVGYSATTQLSQSPVDSVEELGTYSMRPR
jgi:hypothetical protein